MKQVHVLMTCCLSLFLWESQRGLIAAEKRERWEAVSPTAGTVGDLTVIDGDSSRSLILSNEADIRLLLWTQLSDEEGGAKIGIRDLMSGGELTLVPVERRWKGEPSGPSEKLDRAGRDEFVVEANGRRRIGNLSRLQGDEALLWTLDLREALDPHFRRSLDWISEVVVLEELQPFCRLLKIVSFGDPCAESILAVSKIEREIDCDRDARLGFPCPTEKSELQPGQ